MRDDTAERAKTVLAVILVLAIVAAFSYFAGDHRCSRGVVVQSSECD